MAEIVVDEAIVASTVVQFVPSVDISIPPLAATWTLIVLIVTTLFDVPTLPHYITAREAIGSLPIIEDGGGEDEMDWEMNNPSDYDLLMQRIISFDEFYQRKLYI